MIAIMSNKDDATADFFEAHLDRSGVPSIRLNTEFLAAWSIAWEPSATGVRGTMIVDDKVIDLQDLSALYYRRPVPPTIVGVADPGLAQWLGSELRQAWGGILASLKLTWVNHPQAIDQASYKPEQLARASSFGLSTPESTVTNEPRHAREFCEHMGWDVVAKPVGRGWVRGASLADDRVIYTTALSRAHSDLLDQVQDTPTLLQRRIHRDTDVRVTITGGECFAVDVRLPEGHEDDYVDCRRDNMRDVRYALRQLPDGLRQQLLDLTASYGLAFAAIDLIRDRSGSFWFLELNPAGQWAWLEEKAGVPIAAAILRALQDGKQHATT